MPKVKISEYSATANSNTDVASINIDEGCAPSGINNAIRAVMGHLKDFQSGTSNDPFTVGSSGSLTLSYGTINGVAYLNGAKVLTTGSALVFDGTNLGIGVSPAQTLHVKTSTAATPITLGVLSNSTTLPALSFNGAYASSTMAGTYSLTGSLYTTVPAGAAHYFAVADSIRATLDASGNLGLGFTPSANAGQSTLNISNYNRTLSALTMGSNANSAGYVGYNMGNTSTADLYRYIASDAGSVIYFAGNEMRFMQFASGSAGATTNGTQAMTLNASGNLGVGTSSPTNKLTVKPSGTSNATFDVLTGSTNTDSVRISGGGTVNTWLEMRGYLGIKLYSDATNTVTVDASGNLGIGTTTPTSTYSARLASLAAAGTTALALDAPTGTNTSINWYYNGTAKWSTQVLTTGEYRWYDFVAGSTRMTLDASGRLGVGYTAPTAQLVVGGAGAAGWLNGARNTLQLRFNASSANQSNFISFGSANNEQYCFIGNDINADGTTVNQLNVQAGASGGVFLANTGTSWTAVSDERNKDIIEPITDAMAKVATLRSVIGKYKTDEQDKRRTFLIAQDVQAVLPEAITVGSDENSTLGLSYTDTIPLLVAAIKELKAEFDAYKASQP